MHPVIQMWLLIIIPALISAKWLVNTEDNRMFVLFGAAVMCFITGIGYAITHYM